MERWNVCLEGSGRLSPNIRPTIQNMMHIEHHLLSPLITKRWRDDGDSSQTEATSNSKQHLHERKAPPIPLVIARYKKTQRPPPVQGLAGVCSSFSLIVVWPMEAIKRLYYAAFPKHPFLYLFYFIFIWLKQIYTGCRSQLNESPPDHPFQRFTCVGFSKSHWPAEGFHYPPNTPLEAGPETAVI